MKKLTQFSVNYPVTVSMMVVAILLLGYISFDRLGVDLLPDLNAPRIFIEIKAGEKPPEEIEKQYIEDIEAQSIRQKGVKQISSVCVVGSAQITVEYEWGHDMDEAFLDLTGTARLHGAPPAAMLARLTKRMKDELGITGSIGLAHNKFLAKIASDLDKPRGFAVIGKAETLDFLEPQSVSIIWGVGAATRSSLEKAGIRTIADLRRWQRNDLSERFGQMGERLWHLARGEDRRRVSAHAPVKSISNETTFFEDTSDPDLLDGHIWRLAENVSDRAKAKHKAGRVVTLKLKKADHKSLTRRITLPDATQSADRIYRTARGLFDQVGGQGPFRLIGVGISHLVKEAEADRLPDLLDADAGKRVDVEKATDKIRERFGSDAILKGRSLR